ncbi:M50 family metallopeptidase [Priestia abyssalis]|uniref:M50 family metallopeptidase n=1 Tax=Priestia abyssalis TaxID=1221450 RepID=UPI0009950129|nr:M50 family metallopeptidase [Priestia abyssalis]
MESTTLIYIYLAIALVTSQMPVLGVYTALCNTLLHEVFHVICAACLSGRVVHKITLNKDASGLAVTSVNSRFARVLIFYAGYTGSSLTAIALFYLVNKGHFNTIIYFFITLAVISVLLWVRNFYGFLWAISFISLLGFMVYKKYEIVIMHTSIFLSSVVLLQSIFTAFTVCKLSFTQRKDAGDATSLAQTTLIPAAVWGTVFFGQSLYAGYFVMKNFLI